MPGTDASQAMRLQIHRTDGQTGTYVQSDPRRAAMLVKRLAPERLFRSGPIEIGTLNPVSLINADEICWIEVSTHLATPMTLTLGIDEIVRLPGRDEYLAILERQWKKWRTAANRPRSGLMEALVELAMRGGDHVYLHVIGRETRLRLSDAIFGVPAITARVPPSGTLYINPRCIVRARVYHSLAAVALPDGVWMAEAEDI